MCIPVLVPVSTPELSWTFPTCRRSDGDERTEAEVGLDMHNFTCRERWRSDGCSIKQVFIEE